MFSNLILSYDILMFQFSKGGWFNPRSIILMLITFDYIFIIGHTILFISAFHTQPRSSENFSRDLKYQTTRKTMKRLERSFENMYHDARSY